MILSLAAEGPLHKPADKSVPGCAKLPVLPFFNGRASMLAGAGSGGKLDILK
jgi:hypothetical protein